MLSKANTCTMSDVSNSFSLCHNTWNHKTIHKRTSRFWTAAFDTGNELNEQSIRKTTRRLQFGVEYSLTSTRVLRLPSPTHMSSCNIVETSNLVEHWYMIQQYHTCICQYFAPSVSLFIIFTDQKCTLLTSAKVNCLEVDSVPHGATFCWGLCLNSSTTMFISTKADMHYNYLT